MLFSVGGAIAQVFSFTYLSCLCLYLRIHTFHPSPLLPEMLLVVHFVAACASSVSSPLLPLVSLMLSLSFREPGCLLPLPCSWSSGSQTLPQQGGSLGGSRVMGASATAGVIGFAGTNVLGRGPELHTSSQLEGCCLRLHCCCCTVPCDHVHCCGQDVEIVHHFPCCYQVLWGFRLICHDQGSKIADITSAVALVPAPLCVPVQPPLDVQMHRIL